MFPKLSIALFLFFAVYTASGQTTVRGRVISSPDKMPVPGAGLYLLAPDSSATFLAMSDSLGRFEFRSAAGTTIKIRISARGFQNLIVDVPTDKSVVDLPPLLLEQSTTLLNAVVITAAPISQSAAGNVLIRVATNRSLTATQNFLETLKRIPGISVNGENSISMAGGVQPEVFINGRPLQLSGAELISYLQGLSPERVQSVELITNPSARYDGEYKAILDIRLKREYELGWAASYTGQLDQNRYRANYQHINLNLKAGGLQGFAAFNYAGGRTIYRYAAFQHLANTDFQTTRMDQANGQQNLNLQTGLEYAINEKSNIGAVLRYYRPLNQRERDGSIYSRMTSGATAFHYINTNPVAFRQENLGLNVYYNLLIKNFRLDILAGRLRVENNQDDDFLNTDAASGLALDHWKSDLSNRFLIYSGQLDVSQKIQDWKIEAGAKLVSSASSNSLRFDLAAFPDGPLLFDPSRSSAFNYDEQVKAAYLSLSRSLGKFSISAGFRAEHTRSLANTLTLDSIRQNQYVKWLPSLHASYTISADQDLSVSYSSRLTRPNFSQLNPFRSYFSVLNYWIGNPYLLPAMRNQFRASYRYKQLLVEGNFGSEKDVLGRYPLYDAASGELAYLGTNFPRSRFANMTVSFPLSFRPWWQLNYQFTGNYNKETIRYLSEEISVGVYHFVTRLSQTFSLPKTISVNLLANYNSRTGNSLYVIRQAYNIDLAVEKKWLGGKLTTKIGALDIFDTNHQYLIFRRKDLINNELHHWFGNQKGQFSLTYNFSPKPYKARKQITSEEESRVR